MRNGRATRIDRFPAAIEFGKLFVIRGHRLQVEDDEFSQQFGNAHTAGRRPRFEAFGRLGIDLDVPDLDVHAQIVGAARVIVETPQRQDYTQPTLSKWSRSSATLRRLARNATSKASPRNGTVPAAPSIATLSSMRAKMPGGTPSRCASYNR